MANQNQTSNDNTRSGDTSNRGFASMDDDKQRKIAQKGGEAVSQDREHMSQIGRKGGEASHGGGNQGGSRSGGSQGGNQGGNQGGRNS
jgi:general stress protein YciG